MNTKLTPLKTTKQVLMNKINLPYDVMDTVKSFAFYDKKTATEIMKHRANMKKITNLIKSAETRRTNAVLFMSFGGVDDDIEDIINERWCFRFDIEHPHYGLNPIQMQNENCRICGNYKYQYGPNYNYANIFCHGFCRSSV